jgi:CRISPR-associated endonuclease/helicase Cas3
MKLNSDGAIEMVQDAYPVLRNMAAYNEQVGLCVNKGEVWQADELII